MTLTQPTATQSTEAYIADLRTHLAPITLSEREDILREITAHIRDSAESGTGPSSDPASDHILSSVPIHIDLTATRAWGSPQTWRQTTPLPPTRPHRRK